MNNNPVVWFEIYVQDLDKAKAFYEQVFEVALQNMDMQEFKMLMFPGKPDAFGASGALVKMEGVPSGGNSSLVYFACEDCAVQAQRAVDAGGKLFKPKFSIGEYGFAALVHDTEGNMIGLHSMQ